MFPPSVRACALALLSAAALAACTTGVISGKATKDGRPILWKNRDTSDLHNHVVRCEDGRYAYVGIANEGDPGGLEIWSGVNAAGFAIMNNVSYNLGTDGETSSMEGTLMKLALQSCATVEDFQALLARTAGRHRQVASNFGVIDGRGGAAYFETDEKGMRRYDAADAPGGFLVRTNYSFSGREGKGSGYLREARAQDLVGGLQAAGRLSVATLLADVARDTANARLGSFPARTRAGFAYVGDSISRQGTAATSNAFVVQGAGAGHAATAWVILGQPATGVAVPLWVRAGAVPPELATGASWAPLHAAFERVRLHVYPDHEADPSHYLDAARLYDPEKGVAAPFLDLERRNLEAAAGADALDDAALKALQERIAGRTLAGVLAILDSRRIP